MPDFWESRFLVGSYSVIPPSTRPRATQTLISARGTNLASLLKRVSFPRLASYRPNGYLDMVRSFLTRQIASYRMVYRLLARVSYRGCGSADLVLANSYVNYFDTTAMHCT